MDVNLQIDLSCRDKSPLVYFGGGKWRNVTILFHVHTKLKHCGVFAQQFKKEHILAISGLPTLILEATEFGLFVLL